MLFYRNQEILAFLLSFHELWLLEAQHGSVLESGEVVGADGQFAKPDLNLMKFMKELVEKRRKAA